MRLKMFVKYIPMFARIINAVEQFRKKWTIKLSDSYSDHVDLPYI